MSENRIIRETALEQLRGNWTQPVLCTLVYFIVVSIAEGILGFIPGIGSLAALLITAPLGFGFTLTFLNYMRGIERDDMVGQPFKCFNNYGRYLGVSLLTALYTILWCLLLIVPGIIKSYSYAMTPYIMNDNPELTADQCIEKSMKMMDGYKWKLFLLDLSFIGWGILCIFTLFIGLLWLEPYIACSRARFYEELKSEQNEGPADREW